MPVTAPDPRATASPGGSTTLELTEPLTPEEEAALHELAATHRRRHRWVALFWSVTVSVHTTIILHTVWHDWPLDAHGLGRLTFFVVNALGGLGLSAWSLRSLRTEEALDRQRTRQDVRWRAQDRAWRQHWEESRRQWREGSAG
jgi:hypothetical protein